MASGHTCLAQARSILPQGISARTAPKKHLQPSIRTSGAFGKLLPALPALGNGRRLLHVASAAADDGDDNFDLDALLADLEAPVLEGEPRYYQEAAGGEFEDGIAVSFGNEEAALEALENSVVLMDRSHWGRLRVSGPDRLSFLHNQSTADILRLKPGQGTDTVLVTAQARTVDLATALVQENGVMVIVSPGQADDLAARLNKFIFPLDKVEVADISSKCGMLTVAGPACDELLQNLKADAIIGQPEGSHILLNFGGSPVIVVAGTGLGHPGYTFIVDDASTGELWRQLAMIAIPMGERLWEQVRVLQGRPAPGSELTDDYNPLEAGLFHAVSLAKGCYIGQETIAKVHNLDAVKQELWGLEMASPCIPGAKVTATDEGDKKPLGAVTSVTTTADGRRHIAMAYLRCKNKGEKVDLEGTSVLVNGKSATVVALPYLTRAFAPEDLPGAAGDGEKEQAKADADLEAEAEAKAAKMKAMQDRLAAYQAQMAAAKKDSEA